MAEKRGGRVGVAIDTVEDLRVAFECVDVADVGDISH